LKTTDRWPGLSRQCGIKLERLLQDVIAIFIGGLLTGRGKMNSHLGSSPSAPKVKRTV